MRANGSVFRVDEAVQGEVELNNVRNWRHHLL